MVHSAKPIGRFSPGISFAFGVIFLLVGSLVFIKCKENSHEATTTSDSGQEKYVLIIYNNNELSPDHDKEYEAWVKTVSAEHKIEWKNLHDNGWVLSPGPGGPAVETRSEFQGNNDVESYFVFEAKNSEDALNLAKTCPRLNYKGTVELRQIH
ncbi:MAG TPA: hypothetical protein VFG10_06260 [Saprospiraceae bacterium]|nr:hypothetical protein [Saprospiraceae bacterium]